MINNPLPVPEMKTILEYRPHTGEFFWKERNVTAGQRTRHGYTVITVRGKSYMAHHIAWALTYHVWPVGRVKHINGNRFDNRITNITLANPENWKLSTKSQRPPWE